MHSVRSHDRKVVRPGSRGTQDLTVLASSEAFLLLRFDLMLRRNVLIFHSAALGDFVMTWPLAMALARTLAQSRIIYVTASQKGQLAERVIGVEYNDLENGWHALHADTPTLADIPTKLLSGMQMGVVLSQSLDPTFMTNLQRFAGDHPVLHIAPNPPAGVPVWQHQLAQLATAPVIQKGVEQVQHLIRTRGLLTSPPKEPKRVVIHPGSGAARKNWPIEKFVEVAKLLKKMRRDVVVTLGEVERESIDRAALDALSSVATIRSCDTLLELYDTLASSGAYVGNDSGPTHLAAALGRRVVALFGPTSDAAAWSPVGPQVNVLEFGASPDQVVSHLA